MRRVTQTVMVEIDEHGIRVPSSTGDCYPACVASIFEIPIWMAPGMSGNSQDVHDWLALNYPGVGVVVRDWKEPRDHVHHSGYWIATVRSPRFRDICHDCTTDRRRKSNPPYCWRRDQCPHCQGTGYAPGRHAVVMEHARRVWDPHPKADWDLPVEIVGETIFTVTDPSRLHARVIPISQRAA